MKILVLNCGSSSVKYQLIEMDDEQLICKGIVERIGTEDAILRYCPTGRPEKREVRPVPDHAAAIHAVISALLDPEIGVIRDKSDISAVGHRTVHGGEAFANSVKIDQNVIQSIKDFSKFAPLHNPHNLKGIEVCMELLPNTPQVAVFDTAFHQTMPASSYLYALPRSLYDKLGIRRYGFHGTSHHYVAQRAAEELGRPTEKLKIITCHLGNGASVAAVKHGESVDTSMGFTPVEGLLMGTRCGDLDPAALLHVMEQEELSLAEANPLLNKHSGLIGISGVSSDMREIISEMDEGNKQARLAFDVFCYRIKKYIGAYSAVLGGLDAVVFTGGIGENASRVREASLAGLEHLGIELDPGLNARKSQSERAIQAQNSRVAVIVIPTNEELVIALETERVIAQAKKKTAEKVN